MKRTSLYVCALLLLASSALAETQAPVSSWGLDRIDQRSGTNGNYVFNQTGGNTIIYVLDIGVSDVTELGIMEHRVYGTASANDHGTAVASIAAGATHGVAKGAVIIDVNIANVTNDDPNVPFAVGVTRKVIGALNDIWQQHPAGWQGVVNYSGRIDLSWVEETLAEEVRSEFRAAIQSLLANGITVVAAATNYGPTACDELPAGLGTWDGVITVSSVEPNGTIQNGAGIGDCVDLFAPHGVTASSGLGNEITFSHTSSSAPFVAGAAALILEQHRFLSPNEIENLLKANATHGIVSGNIGASNNALLYTLLPPVAMPINPLRTGQSGTASIPPVAGATYSWNLVNATVVGSSTGPSVSFVAGCAGWVTATVTVTTAEGSVTGHGLAQVLASTASVTGTTSINAGQSATLGVSLTGTGPWTVTWNDSVQQTFTTASGTRTVTPATTTTYRISSVRDGANCNGTTSGTAIVTVCQTAPATITAPASGYTSKTVTASVPATAGATYQWTITNGLLWNGQGTNNATVILGCAGNTTVSVTVTSSCGAPNTSTKTIQNIAGSATVWNSSTINAGETALIAATFNGTLPWSITWSDGMTQTSLITSTIYREVSPETTTTYTATAAGDKRGCSATVSGSATVTVQ